LKPSIEEIRKKYQKARREKINFDLSSLKREIESFINKLRASNERDEKMLNEAQDMLIDLIQIIEESHCQPLKSKILQF
jgi:uncharacterized coiled-coil DUF342 family protein